MSILPYFPPVFLCMLLSPSKRAVSISGLSWQSDVLCLGNYSLTVSFLLSGKCDCCICGWGTRVNMSADRPSWVAGIKCGFFTHTNIHTHLDGIRGSPANVFLCFAALPLVICKVTQKHSQRRYKSGSQTIPNTLLLIQFYKYTYTHNIHNMLTFLVSCWARICFSSSNSSICRTNAFIILSVHLDKLHTGIFVTNSPLNSNSGHFCTASSTERKSINVIHRFLQSS